MTGPPSEPGVLDCHHHVGYLPGIHPQGATFRGVLPDDDAIRADIELRASLLDSAGVAQAVVIPTHGYVRPDGLADTRAANDLIARYRDLAPDRFPAAVGVVEPVYGEHGLAELDRIRNDLGLVGVSFHARFQGAGINHPWVRRYCERMGELGLIPYMHVIAEIVDEAPWKLAELAMALPEITFLALDGFSSIQRMTESLFIAQLTPNIVFDTSFTPDFARVERFIGKVGAERIVYGTDQYSVPSPEHGTGEIVRQIRASSLSADEQAAVLGGNARKLLFA